MRGHGSDIHFKFVEAIGVSRRPCPPNFLAYPVISRFEKRCYKQNTVACIKSNNLAPPKFLAGYATG